jgi:choice-of-anchor B domain-containing protein
MVINAFYHDKNIRTMQKKLTKGLPKKNRDKLLSIIGFLSLILLTSNLFAQSPSVNTRLRSKLSFPTVSGANICGYAANGREYALHSTENMIYIIDVTNPDVPKVLRKIPAAPDIWHEIKVYRNYAYIVSEDGTLGMQIVDLSRLPDTTGIVKSFKSDSARGLLTASTAHALHIDTAKGFCYLFGGGHKLSSGVIVQGATVLDIKTDPLNPRYVGYYNQRYVHDGYVENDTLYAAQINNGNFAIIDFKDKANPIILSTTTTPTVFTHNTWLTSNHKTVLTTDENCGSYLASYDVTNPQEPRFLDKIRSVSQRNAMIHNTHVVNDYAVTSWYTEGVVITDAHRPQNLVNVGQYDTDNSLTGQGAWGVYPFLPSGNLVISNYTGGDFFVVTPQYKRACYLEGTIMDASTNQPLTGVRVKINSTDMDKAAESGLLGGYATGQVTAGSFQVTYSKKGYVEQTVTVNLATAQVTIQNITMAPPRTFSASGNVTAASNGAALANVKLLFKSSTEEFSALTNAQGAFSTNLLEGTYAIYAGGWGFSSKFIGKQTINSNVTNLSAQLQRSYQDDFWGDFGWTILGSQSGTWARGSSVAVSIDSALVQPEGDSPTDNDSACFFTGIPSDVCSNSSNSVYGTTNLTSPPMTLSAFSDPQLTFNYWFYNGGGTLPPNDTFRVLLNNGLREVEILRVGQSASTWRQSPVLKLKNYLPLTDNMTVTFQLADSRPNFNITEGAIDNFRLTDGLPNSVQDVANDWTLKAYPNPFTQSLNVDFQLDKNVNNAQIKVINALGQVMEAQKLVYTEGSLSVGSGLPTGIYFVKIEAEGKASRVVRVVKQ